MILGPLLFSIDLYDLLVLTDQHDIANFPDENAPYLYGKTLMRLLNRYKKHRILISNELVTNSFKEMQANAMFC